VKFVVSLGHCLIDTQQQKTLTYSAKSTVYFVNASDREISSYIYTGEPMNCAGCFTLEGLGGLLVERIDGCHTNVLGLSLPLLRKMLKELGYSLDFGGQTPKDRATNLVW
jgi:septum formation protein